MSALIIGGDKIITIKKGLKEKGFDIIKHVSGRNSGDKSGYVLNEAQRCDLVIILTDYISHGVVRNIKKNMDCENIIFTKRSWPIIEQHIDSFTK